VCTTIRLGQWRARRCWQHSPRWELPLSTTQNTLEAKR
jgi:hypothetical protein